MKPTKKRKFSMYGMSFNNINKAGPLTKQFIKFIKSCERYGYKATKRGFYNIMGRELHPGNNSTFFSAINQSGIVTLNRKWNGTHTECWYTPGPNWGGYLNGTFNN